MSNQDEIWGQWVIEIPSESIPRLGNVARQVAIMPAEIIARIRNTVKDEADEWTSGCKKRG